MKTIVQIAVASAAANDAACRPEQRDPIFKETIVALCEDGSAYKLNGDNWDRLPNIEDTQS